MRSLALALSLVACACGCLADYCPPDSELSGGMRDIMLAYISPGHWARDDFVPYVAYLDRANEGKPRDWFYDSFLFLMFGGAPSGGAYYNGTANKADWEHYLDLLFSPDHNLAALDACIEDVGERLDAPDRVCPVIIMAPYLSRKLDGFGDVDGDGQEEKPSVDADRIKAFRWAVDSILERWARGLYPHLRLWGFYWMNEGISRADDAVVRATADHVHSKGLGFHWIPWFRAPGYDRWRELGFDFVVMQPNYAFAGIPAGAVVPDEDRLTQNSNSARALGLGVEMELPYRTATDPAARLRLRLYLNHGVDDLDGCMREAVRAYYQGYDDVAKLYRSENPDCNQLYDDLYRFHKGTYQRRAVSLCEGAPCTLNGRPAPKLTDGLWMTRGERRERLLTARSPAVIDVDLGAAQIVGDVRVHVVARGEGQPAPPSKLRVLTSADGREFQQAAEVACPPLNTTGDWKAGFALALFEPRFARRLRIETLADGDHEVGVDEIVVFPAPHLLWGIPYRVEGELSPDSAPAHGLELTDGRLVSRGAEPGGLRFTGATASVHFDLDEAWYLDRALAHVHWPQGTEAPSARVRIASDTMTKASQWASPPRGGEAWIEMPLPRAPAETVTFDLKGGPQVAWDELQVRRAPNLARGKPYRIIPPFDATYPDTGGTELTDGQLTERGFGDGKTVGWYGGTQATVLLDLGATKTIDAVRVHAQGGGYAAVHYPATIGAWASEDAEEWTLLAQAEPAKEITFSENVQEELNELAWLRLDFAPTSARYLELRFVPRGWLMLSEIEALSGDENMAAGCAYHFTPAPKSGQKYADNGARFTDGEYSRGGGGWKKAVGWDEVNPEIVVDLLRPADISLVRVHCLGGGNGAVFFPRSIALSTSLDGEEWSEETVVDEHPAEDGKEFLTAFMGVTLEPRQARYVRLRVDRKGWAMLDEIEVYSPPGQ